MKESINESRYEQDINVTFISLDFVSLNVLYRKEIYEFVLKSHFIRKQIWKCYSFVVYTTLDVLE